MILKSLNKKSPLNKNENGEVAPMKENEYPDAHGQGIRREAAQGTIEQEEYT